MVIQVSVDPEDIHELTTDDRGRAYLGTEHANKTVQIAVLDDDVEP